MVVHLCCIAAVKLSYVRFVIYFIVQGQWWSSSVDEHCWSVSQPTRNIFLLLTAILSWTKEGHKSLPWDTQWGTAGRWAGLQWTWHRFQRYVAVILVSLWQYWLLIVLSYVTFTIFVSSFSVVKSIISFKFTVEKVSHTEWGLNIQWSWFCIVLIQLTRRQQHSATSR